MDSNGYGQVEQRLRAAFAASDVLLTHDMNTSGVVTRSAGARRTKRTWRPVLVAAAVAAAAVIPVAVIRSQHDGSTPSGGSLSRPTSRATGTSPSGSTTSFSRVEANLSQLAGVIDRLGQSQFADVYSGLSVQADHDQVVVYVTDLQRGDLLAAQADAQVPKALAGHERLVTAPYTAKMLQADIEKVMSQPTIEQWHVTSAAPASDATGILVTTSRGGVSWLASVKSALEQLIRVPVTVSYETLEPLSGVST